MRTVNQIIEEVQNWFNPSLETVFDKEDADLTTAKAAMYSLLSGGKRLRPCFMYVVAKAIGADMNDVLVFARSLEMIHTYSLIHDDLPCLDNDDLRRGKPTCHKMFGDDFATLAGDCLLNRAGEFLFEIVVNKPEYSYAAFNMFRCSGIRGMIGGQDIDVSSTNKQISAELLKELHERKTGALLEAAICTPVYLKEGKTNSELFVALKSLASNVGLAFQIKDDLLDVFSTSSVLGKTVGKDSRDNKSTYVTLFGVEKAQEMMNNVIDEANNNLNKIEALGYDVDDLKVIVDYVVSRDR
ncbi:MAG: polyprenyl synthetase family protein [Clostridia bacterium]|nr:polyprenyl synthetase family protein [Clostridia bacterium]